MNRTAANGQSNSEAGHSSWPFKTSATIILIFIFFKKKERKKEKKKKKNNNSIPQY
jgi:hypothetical protein